MCFCDKVCSWCEECVSVIQPVVGVYSMFCCTACSWSEECVFVIHPVVGVRSVFS